MFGKRKNDDDDNMNGPFIFGNEPDNESTEAEISGEIDWADDFEEPEDIEDEDFEDFPGTTKQELYTDDWDEPAPVAEPPAAAPKVEPVRPKETVTMTNQTRPIRRTTNQMDFETALKIVEMKFQFWKFLAAYVIGSAIVFLINFILNKYEYEMAWWFQWPLLVYGLFLIFPFCRAYIFRGQDIQSMVKGKLHRMAEREIERTEIYED